MSQEPKEIGAEDDAQEKRLTPEIQKAIEDLIYQKKQIARDNEAYNESASAVAEKLGIKPNILKSRVALIIKEEEKGGEVKSKTSDIDFVEEYFLVKAENERK